MDKYILLVHLQVACSDLNSL